MCVTEREKPIDDVRVWSTGCPSWSYGRVSPLALVPTFEREQRPSLRYTRHPKVEDTTIEAFSLFPEQNIACLMIYCKSFSDILSFTGNNQFSCVQCQMCLWWERKCLSMQVMVGHEDIEAKHVCGGDSNDVAQSPSVQKDSSSWLLIESSWFFRARQFPTIRPETTQIARPQYVFGTKSP